MNKLVSQEIVGEKVPILCNQENFILKANLYRLFQEIPGFHFFVNPAVKEFHDKGRPKNGMFICVPDKIKNSVSDVSPGHWRVQAVIISQGNNKTLLINSYFPFDERESEEACLDDLDETIGVIKNIIRNCESDAVMLVGDINADYTRNTPHTRTVKESLDELQLVTAWDTFQADFTHTYEREGPTFISTLDHIYMSKDIFQTALDAGVIHDPDNTSDHEPIYCVFQSLSIYESTNKSATFQPRPSWRLASEEEKEMYKYRLEDSLKTIMVPTQITECQELHCKDEEHLAAIDWLSTEVLEAVQRAGEESLPFPKAGSLKKGMKATPGFKVQVKPFKDEAYFWSSVWKSAGRPLNTQLHGIMKRTRNKYHRELKKCHKSEEIIKKSRLLDACLNGEGDLFREIKSMRKTKPVHADKIDGESKDIPNHFRNIYSNLYNSVRDSEEVNKISDEVNKNISNENISDVNRVTIEEVKKAAAALKPGKSCLLVLLGLFESRF